uniref:Uncharacterized protein n=1 Tax=Meloidogyne enterolobii TaxID=390850 RepID=A0A6V7WRI9_MELEN|nr:unnamed protein product [Meloidogyne enterolobii]
MQQIEESTTSSSSSFSACSSPSAITSTNTATTAKAAQLVRLMTQNGSISSDNNNASIGGCGNEGDGNHKNIGKYNNLKSNKNNNSRMNNEKMYWNQTTNSSSEGSSSFSANERTAAFDPDLSTIRARTEGAELVNIGGCGGAFNNNNNNNNVTTIHPNTPTNNIGTITTNIAPNTGLPPLSPEQHQLLSTMFASPPASQAAILQLYMALRGNNNNGNEQNFQGICSSPLLTNSNNMSLNNSQPPSSHSSITPKHNHNNNKDKAPQQLNFPLQVFQQLKDLPLLVDQYHNNTHLYKHKQHFKQRLEFFSNNSNIYLIG